MITKYYNGLRNMSSQRCKRCHFPIKKTTKLKMNTKRKLAKQRIKFINVLFCLATATSI